MAAAAAAPGFRRNSLKNEKEQGHALLFFFYPRG
jgi:hypothetical protein